MSGWAKTEVGYVSFGRRAPRTLRGGPRDGEVHEWPRHQKLHTTCVCPFQDMVDLHFAQVIYDSDGQWVRTTCQQGDIFYTMEPKPPNLVTEDEHWSDNPWFGHGLGE